MTRRSTAYRFARTISNVKTRRSEIYPPLFQGSRNAQYSSEPEPLQVRGKRSVLETEIWILLDFCLASLVDIIIYRADSRSTL
jgi:hypothetical protein